MMIAGNVRSTATELGVLAATKESGCLFLLQQFLFEIVQHVFRQNPGVAVGIVVRTALDDASSRGFSDSFDAHEFGLACLVEDFQQPRRLVGYARAVTIGLKAL